MKTLDIYLFGPKKLIKLHERRVDFLILSIKIEETLKFLIKRQKCNIDKLY